MVFMKFLIDITIIDIIDTDLRFHRSYLIGAREVSG